MARKKKTTVTEVTKEPVLVKDLKVGDIIYLDLEDNDTYTVLDVGDPFILLEDFRHFANLYRVTKPLYKDI